MTESPTTFIQQTGPDTFRVDSAVVAPESLFTTEILLQEIIKRRNLAKGLMLDIGCGTKPYRSVFSGLVSAHWGVDVPITMHHRRAIDAYAPSHALPFKAESFDFVLCTEVLEHVPDPGAAWEEIGRLLKPGGIALVTTPFIYRFHEMPYDFWRITPPAHQMMAKRAGLEVQEIACRGGFISTLVDVKLKGLVYVARAIRKLFNRPQRPGPVTRWIFATIQRPLFFLLRGERIKSDEFTIGLVVVARKPATL